MVFYFRHLKNTSIWKNRSDRIWFLRRRGDFLDLRASARWLGQLVLAVTWSVAKAASRDTNLITPPPAQRRAARRVAMKMGRRSGNCRITY